MGQADQIVSVVMPVRNALPYLDVAIESILAQTHPHFELIIGDDGSTDGSGERLEYWARRDRRIRLLRHQGCGQGPAGSSDWVTRQAQHELIARMDADDISMPGRLGAQIQRLQADPGAAMVGSLCDYVDTAGRRIAGRDRSIFRNPRCIFPCAHGSLMFRRSVFERVGGYRQQCDYWEDVDLFLRMAREGRMLVLPEVLYRYRYSTTSARQVSDEAKVARALDLSVRCLRAHGEGRDYEPLLEESRHAPPPKRVSLSVVALVGLERLWRGDPGTIFKSWAWRHASLGRRRHRVRILVFATWVRFSPRSLRTLFRLKARFADWRARNAVADATVHVWRGDAAAQDRPLARGQTPAIAFSQQSTAAEPRTAAGGQLVAAAGATRFHGPA